MLSTNLGRNIERVVIENGQTLLRTIPATAFPAWTIVVPHTPGYVHLAALQELVEAVFYGLVQLDHTVSLANPLEPVPKNAILIGAHLLSPEQCKRVPDGVIVYNSEHTSSDWMSSQYKALLTRVVVWDYSFDNARMLQSILSRPVHYVPIGYVPQFTKITTLLIEDIDVLFCGSYSERRSVIFNAIRSKGLNMHHAFGIYGAERDKLIARAKIVLNLHAYLPGAFEVVRVSYLLANRKAVVSEVNLNERIDADLEGAFVAAVYDEIVAKITNLVANEPVRAAVGLAGFHKFCSRNQAVILRQALGNQLTGAGSTAD